jgi:putative tricarboxylic transport membrane protein
VTLNSFFTTPLRQENLGIDIQTFTPVAMMGVDPFVLWVHKDSGITTFDQWIETVKAWNGEYVMGGTGAGQEDSIVIAYMSEAYDIDIKYIPYDGGGAVARDLAGKQIMATVNNPAEAKGFYEAGVVVPLMAFSDERLPAFPDVPTIKELGHDFSYYNQRAVVGAPGMSDEAAAYYTGPLHAIYESEEWQAYLESESLSPLWMDADAQRAYWATQVENHRELLAALGE